MSATDQSALRTIARALSAPWRRRATAEQLQKARAVLDALRKDGWTVSKTA